MNLRAVKGMNDILPDEIGRWHRLEKTFRATVELHRYEEVRPPLVEPTSLFVRQIGEVTDIVEKEMYSFKHHDDELTLRPGVRRAQRAGERAGEPLVLPRAHVSRRKAAEGTVPPILSGRLRGVRRCRTGHRRRDDRHARRLHAWPRD